MKDIHVRVVRHTRTPSLLEELKNTKYFLAAILASLLVLSACENKSAIEKAEDKVNDALDRRPAEEIRDAAEDVGAAGKDFGEAVKDAAKDVAPDAKAAASNAAEDAKAAAR